MQHEDYIKRQIDQLGRVLGKILIDLLGLKASGNISEGIEVADQTLKNERDLTFDEIASIPAEKFIATLQEEKKLSNDNLDSLAEILFLVAEELDEKGSDLEKKNEMYLRSLILYDHIEKICSTYSLERHLKIKKIQNMQ